MSIDAKREAFRQIVDAAVDPNSPFRNKMVEGIMFAHDALVAQAKAPAKEQPDDGACKHEPFEGRCVHCDVKFIGGEPTINKEMAKPDIINMSEEAAETIKYMVEFCVNQGYGMGMDEGRDEEGNYHHFVKELLAFSQNKASLPKRQSSGCAAVPKWGVWWQGSGPERGDHIMEMTESGVSYANEIAYLGDLHHDAAGKIVQAHNKYSGSVKQKPWVCPTCGSDYKPLCHCEAEEMAATTHTKDAVTP